MVRPSLGHLAFIKPGLVFLGGHIFALALARKDKQNRQSSLVTLVRSNGTRSTAFPGQQP